MFCSAAARAVAAAAFAAANNSLDLAERVQLSHLHLSLSVSFYVMLYMIALYGVATFFFNAVAFVKMLPSLRMHHFGTFLITWSSVVYQPSSVIHVVLVVLAFSMPCFFFFAVLRLGKQLLWQSWYDVVASFEAASKVEEAADTPLTSLFKVYDIFQRNHPQRFRKWSSYEKKFKKCKLHERPIDILFLEMELRAEFRSTPLLRLVQRTWEEAVFDALCQVEEGENDEGGFPDGFDDALSPMEEGKDDVDVVEGDEVAVCTEPTSIFSLDVPPFFSVAPATPKPSILRARSQEQQEKPSGNYVVFSRQHCTLEFVKDETVDQLTFRQVIRSDTHVPALKLRKPSILQKGQQVNNNRVVFDEHAFVHPFSEDLPVKQHGETVKVPLCPKVGQCDDSPRLRRSTRVRKQPDRYIPSF